MAPPHELLIIEPQDRVIAAQKVRVEHDLDAVVVPVEELDAPDLVEDRVRRVVGHVVRGDGRERVALERVDAPFEEDFVFVGEELGGGGELGAGFAVGRLGRVRISVSDVLDRVE